MHIWTPVTESEGVRTQDPHRIAATACILAELSKASSYFTQPIVFIHVGLFLASVKFIPQFASLS